MPAEHATINLYRDSRRVRGADAGRTNLDLTTDESEGRKSRCPDITNESQVKQMQHGDGYDGRQPHDRQAALTDRRAKNHHEHAQQDDQCHDDPSGKQHGIHCRHRKTEAVTIVRNDEPIEAFGTSGAPDSVGAQVGHGAADA